MTKKAPITEADIKVAKNPIHALWIRSAENLERELKELENSITVTKAFLDKAREEVKEWEQ